MNKKQLFIAAIVAMLSVSSVNAATDISGVTGNGGVFDILPEHVNGDVGYRQYDNFKLDAGDIANLIYKYGIRDIETFVNLVDGKIDINGIVNTMRDGNFYNGHAIFVSPNGMVVGASGVLNVGSLSVVTPSNSTYQGLKGDYAADNFTNINQISKLKQDPNAAINIAGMILARNGVDLRGTDINISGGIVNGVTDMNKIETKSQAENLFNSLVNTDGIKSATALENGSLVLIKSADKSGAGINISGKVANIDNGGVFVTNKGENGLTVDGTVASNAKLQLYNTKGDMNVNGVATNKNDTLVITNRETANNLSIGKNAKVTTDNELAVVNDGTGKLALAGNTTSKGKTDIVNRGNGGMEISGTVNAEPSVRIVNRNGKMTLTSEAQVTANNTVRLENEGADGMALNGTMTANNGTVSIENKAGELSVSGNVTSQEGNVTIWNEGSKLSLTSSSNVVGNGNVSIKNSGAEGMSLEGTITNTGETAINNTNGQLLVNGKINNQGNMGIINKENAADFFISKNAQITNEGDLKLVNAGKGDFTVVGKVDNTGNMYVYNDNGKFTLSNDKELTTAGALTNHDGNLFIFSRGNSTGISAQENSVISNDTGNLAINHKGTTPEGERGLNLQGNISNANGETAINNYSGDMYVSGNIQVEDGNLGIINRQGGGEVTFASAGTITQTGVGTTNIKNYGSGNMTVNNEISHEGRLNILGNTNHLTLGGKIHNNGGEYTYVASRENGTGLTTTSGFSVDGSGNVLIKNITGSDGLDFNGTINNENGTQTALVNHKGDMNINGTINNTGSPVVISNKGDGLNITENSTIKNDTDVTVVNTGTKAADVKGKIDAPEGKYNFIERLKKLFQ